MSIPAVVSFCGFPDHRDCDLALPDAGYPAAVALDFAAARRAASRPAAFLGRFRTLHAALQPRPVLPGHPSDPADGDLYHYRVRLVSRQRSPLIVDCWRRYPGALGWQRRCGPMALERFTERFAPPPGSGYLRSEPLGHGRLAGIGAIGGGGA